MSEQLQLRRGSASQVAAFTGAQGELAVDTTNNVIHVNDGATAGGWAHALATRTTVSDAAYSALVTDRQIAYTAITAARVVSLPAAASYPAGAVLEVVDESGNCSLSKTITVSRAGSDTISGLPGSTTSAVLSGPNASIALESNGVSQWTVLRSRNASAARTAVSDAAYSALITDRMIAYIAISASRTVSLPAAAAFPAGTPLWIVDESGSVTATNTIVAARAGSDTIDGATSATISAAYGAMAIESNGSNAWTVIEQSLTPLADIAAIASDTILGNNGGSSAAPSALTVANVLALLGIVTAGAVAKNVNFNSANTDTAIAVPTLPTGFTRYSISNVRISGASASITTATFGLYTASGGGGVPIISGQAITVSATADATNNNAMQISPADANTMTFLVANEGTLYFRVGTAEGSAATANVELQLVAHP